MRKSVAAASIFIALGLASGEAVAYDNFIPLGLGYSTQNVDLSQLTPEERAAIGKADVYETELYLRQLEAKKLDSRLNHFHYDRQGSAWDDSIDY